MFYRRPGFLVVLQLLAGHWGSIGRSFYEFLTVQSFDTAKTRSGPRQRGLANVGWHGPHISSDTADDLKELEPTEGTAAQNKSRLANPI